MQKPNETTPVDAPSSPAPTPSASEKATAPDTPLRSWRGPSGQTSSAHRAYGLERTFLGTHIPETIDRMLGDSSEPKYSNPHSCSKDWPDFASSSRHMGYAVIMISV